MQDTRQQILEILKRYGEVTVQELSHELGLTSVTVRHHLEILRSEGYITEPEVRRSSRPGRPRYVSQLTSTAADLFPNNYSGLADALLGALEECTSSESCDAVIHKAAERIAADAGPLPLNYDERMDKALAFLNRQGFVGRWAKNDEGKYLVYISGCPYHYVARAHGLTCKIDERLIQLLTGGEIRRVQGMAHQGALCIYEILWRRASA